MYSNLSRESEIEFWIVEAKNYVKEINVKNTYYVLRIRIYCIVRIVCNLRIVCIFHIVLTCLVLPVLSALCSISVLSVLSAYSELSVLSASVMSVWSALSALSRGYGKAEFKTKVDIDSIYRLYIIELQGQLKSKKGVVSSNFKNV